MKDRDLIQAVMQGVEFDASEDRDLARRVALVESVLGRDALDVAAGLLGIIREKERREAGLMDMMQSTLNLDGRELAV